MSGAAQLKRTRRERETDMVAYDYDAQRWIEGEAAARLLEQQRVKTAPLQEDPAYLAFINGCDDVCIECGMDICCNRGRHADDCSIGHENAIDGAE